MKTTDHKIKRTSASAHPIVKGLYGPKDRYIDPAPSFVSDD